MAEEQTSRELLERLVERLDHLERILQSNTARLHAVERRLGLEAPRLEVEPRQRRPLYESLADERDRAQTTTPAPPVSQPSAPPVTQSPAPPVTQPHAPHVEAAQDVASPPSDHSEEGAPHDARSPQAPLPGGVNSHPSSEAQTPPFTPRASGEQRRQPPASAREGKRRDIEFIVGGKLFNWVGIIFVTFAVAFFLKLAFDNQWIGPTARVAIGAVAGAVLLGLGERLQRRGLKQYAFVLSGGGILILYLSIYAAHNFYQLVSQPPAFLLMALVTAAAVLLSVRLNALPVAILGLAGGFLTPVLLSTGQDNEVALFTYVALLDAGVLSVAYFKRWRSLDFLSFAGTVLMTAGWALSFYHNDKLWTTLFFISVFFVLYALLAVFHNVLPGRPTRWFDVSLLTSNATLYFGLSYLLLGEARAGNATPAAHALLVSLFFAGLFYATWSRSREDLLLKYSYIGAAVTFLTVALAIEFELQWVTIGWSVEALMLVWVGLRSGERAARHAALFVFCAAVVHWFAFDAREFAYGVDASFTPLLNKRALSCSVLVASLVTGARLHRLYADESDEEERSTVAVFFALTGNALALVLLTLDVNDYFNARLTGAGTQGDPRARLENARHFSLSTLWAIYGATLLALGLLKRRLLLRVIGFVLLAAAAGDVIYNSTFYAAAWHVLVFNHTSMAYALLVAALAAGARFYARAVEVDAAERSVALPVLAVAANALALAALSLEAAGYYDRAASLFDTTVRASASAIGETLERLEEGKFFALVVVWVLYGACAFLYGARRRRAAWRYGGLLALAMATPLALLLDMKFYSAAWHALVFNRTLAAFALLVAALWLVARAYARSFVEFDEASTLLPVVTVVANVLALFALSAEAAGYFDSRASEALSRVFQTTPGLSSGNNLGLASGAGERRRDLELAKQLSLSVIWALYGAGLLIAGRVRRVRLLRLMALVLLSLTTLKVFFWDLSSLDRAYRIVSFVVLGAILLAVSYLYQKSQQRAATEEDDAAPHAADTTEATG